MLCHAMPCHAMPCHAMPCHAMPCHAMPCHAMLYHKDTSSSIFIYLFIVHPLNFELSAGLGPSKKPMRLQSCRKTWHALKSSLLKSGDSRGSISCAKPVMLTVAPVTALQPGPWSCSCPCPLLEPFVLNITAHGLPNLLLLLAVVWLHSLR